SSSKPALARSARSPKAAPAAMATACGEWGESSDPQFGDQTIFFAPQIVQPALHTFAKHRIVLIIAAEQLGGDRPLANVHSHLAHPVRKQIEHGGPAIGIDDGDIDRKST